MAKLSAKSDDLESRMRCNNIPIHGIPEGAEKNNIIDFITRLIKSNNQSTGDREIVRLSIDFYFTGCTIICRQGSTHI